MGSKYSLLNLLCYGLLWDGPYGTTPHEMVSLGKTFSGKLFCETISSHRGSMRGRDKVVGCGGGRR